MNKHKISVIIPIYNCAEWIEECVNSILNQKLPDHFDTQVIFIDDGSTDEQGKYVILSPMNREISWWYTNLMLESV